MVVTDNTTNTTFINVLNDKLLVPLVIEEDVDDGDGENPSRSCCFCCCCCCCLPLRRLATNTGNTIAIFWSVARNLLLWLVMMVILLVPGCSSSSVDVVDVRIMLWLINHFPINRVSHREAYVRFRR